MAATSFYMEFGFDNIQQELQSLDEEVKALVAANGSITTTSGSGAPIAPQLIGNELRAGENMASMQSEVKELKSLVQSLVTQQNAASSATVAATGLLASDTPLAWGLTALAGLILGAVFTYLRLSVGRKNNKAG